VPGAALYDGCVREVREAGVVGVAGSGDRINAIANCKLLIANSIGNQHLAISI
jgi:hypothetical protein